MSNGFGARATTSVRLRQGAYYAQLAHRRINHEWPEVIQRLWYSCNTAHSTYLELEQAMRCDTMGSMRLGELVQLAWQAWQEIERYAAPIVAAVEAGQ